MLLSSLPPRSRGRLGQAASFYQQLAQLSWAIRQCRCSARWSVLYALMAIAAAGLATAAGVGAACSRCS